MAELIPDEEALCHLDLHDPDAIVEYMLKFYKKNNIKDENDLTQKLTELHPIRTAIELQKQKSR